MHAQLTYFDGPLSAERIEAFHRANRDRIVPALSADPQLRGELVANYVLSQPDGGQVVVTIANSEAALLRGQEVIMATELLPGEQPALLPGPDGIETYRVVVYTDSDRALVTSE